MAQQQQNPDQQQKANDFPPDIQMGSNQYKSEKTAEDQSNDKADVEITRKIRAELQDKNVSTYAKNVKIIVAGGKVTLKGPVRTQAEIDMIKKIASTNAPKYKVQNELQVAK